MKKKINSPAIYGGDDEIERKLIALPFMTGIEGMKRNNSPAIYGGVDWKKKKNGFSQKKRYIRIIIK